MKRKINKRFHRKIRKTIMKGVYKEYMQNQKIEKELNKAKEIEKEKIRNGKMHFFSKICAVKFANLKYLTKYQ